MRPGAQSTFSCGHVCTTPFAEYGLSGGPRPRHGLIYSQEIKYHAFFLEGACYVLAFDMLQDRKSSDRSLPWVRTGLNCLKDILLEEDSTAGKVTTLILAVERMIEAATRTFGLDSSVPESFPAFPGTGGETGENPLRDFGSIHPLQSGSVGDGVQAAETPAMSAEQNDINMDLDWSLNFTEMDTETFLSVDLSQDFNFGV